MNFFEQQESARQTTRRFVLLFALFSLPSMVCFSVLTVFVFGWIVGYTPFEFMEDLFYGRHLAVPMQAGGLLALILAVILFAIKSRRDRDIANYLQDVLAAEPITSGTTDPQLRQALNVCQEIAVAAGMPPPSLYAWNTPALNAFPVGQNIASASIFVTRGALEALSRDEMQALMAHAVGQIANGDMVLNGRLASFLFIYEVTPRIAMGAVVLPVLIVGPDMNSSIRKLMGGVLMTAWIFTGFFPSALLALLSAPPFIFARFVKWLLLRKRKALADATAIQLTRNPRALRDVLVKAMAVGSRPARVPGPLADVAPACFASVGGEYGMSVFPPLETRIRALDPDFELYRSNEIEKMQQRSRQVRNRWEQQAQLAAKAVQQGKQRVFIEKVVTAAQFVASAKSSAPLATHTLTPIATPDEPRALLLALLVDCVPRSQDRQLRALGRLYGEPSVASLQTAVGRLPPMDHAGRTRALDLQLPALRALPPGELRRLQAAIREIQREDALVDAFEFALARVATVFIEDLLVPRASHGDDAIGDRLSDLHVLCCVVAQQNLGDKARSAYEAGMRSLDPGRKFEFAPIFQWAPKLDWSLDGLDSLQPTHKELLLDTVTSILEFDREVTAAERELMRAIAASLHCPLPRLAN